MPSFKTSRRSWVAALVAVPLLAVAGCADVDDEALGTSEDAIVQCALPAKYDFKAFRAANPRSRGVEFSFAPVPELGVYVHEAFIPDARVKVAPGLYLRGDGRTHDANFDPGRTRMTLVVDFVRGKGWFAANSSATEICVFFCRTETRDAHDAVVSFDEGKNRVWADWLDRDTFRVRISGKVSVPGPFEAFACAADEQLLIDRKTGAVRYEGDTFPSTGTYRYEATNGVCSPRPKQRTTAGSSKGLCDSATFTDAADR